MSDEMDSSMTNNPNTRQIRFRAWDTELKDMIIFDNIEELAIGYDGLMRCHDFNKDVMIWMQYTGLTDKNDTEIYEGDLVKTDDDYTGSEVIFDNGSFGLKNSVGQSPLFFYKDSCLVIGNIYQYTP